MVLPLNVPHISRKLYWNKNGLHKTFWGTTKMCENKSLTWFFLGIHWFCYDRFRVLGWTRFSKVKFVFFPVIKWKSGTRTLRKKCPNTEFFLGRIFPYSVRMREDMDQKKVLIWALNAVEKLNNCTDLANLFRIMTTILIITMMVEINMVMMMMETMDRFIDWFSYQAIEMQLMTIDGTIWPNPS